MAWLKSHEELPTHAKTRKAARLLGISIPQMVGHLHLLWWWTMNHAPSGDLSMASADDIADAALWQGDADAFISALETCSVTGGYGFLARTEDGLFVNDWDQHGGTIIQSKKANAQKQLRHRENQKNNEQITVINDMSNGYVTVTHDTHNGNVTKKTASQIEIEIEKEKEIEKETKKRDRGGKSPLSPPKAQEIPTIPNDIKPVLECLQEIPGYPFAVTEDVSCLEKLKAEYPEIDQILETRKFRDYYTDRGFKKNERPRARLRTWFSNAETWRREKHGNNGKRAPTGDVYAEAAASTPSEILGKAFGGIFSSQQGETIDADVGDSKRIKQIGGG